jgi:hypothetical protein
MCVHHHHQITTSIVCMTCNIQPLSCHSTGDLLGVPEPSTGWVTPHGHHRTALSIEEGTMLLLGNKPTNPVHNAAAPCAGCAVAQALSSLAKLADNMQLLRHHVQQLPTQHPAVAHYLSATAGQPAVT